MKSLIRTTLLIAIIHLLVAPVWADSNLDDTQKYAWSENSGWINFKATGGGVVAHRTFLAGFAWAENIGWIKFGADGGGPYANSSASDWGVNRGVTNQLSGYAWSETAGWINVAPTNGGVMLNPSTGEFSGFAWSENLGWIHLRFDTPSYGVLLVVPQLPNTSSSDPEIDTPSNDRTITVQWSGATGNDLGLGYSFLFNSSETGIPNPTIDLAHTTDPHSTTSPPLPDGESHYFHLRSCDTVGNCSDTLHIGPFIVDTTPPQMTSVQTVADTGDGALDEGEAARTGFTQFYLTFDEALSDPFGDSDPGDVTNPDSYLLASAGTDGIIQTVSCSGGIVGDDQENTIDGVVWDDTENTARLSVNAQTPLPRGAYRLLACGSGALADEAGNPLDGNGNGTGGDDALHEFTIMATNRLGNPNFDDSLDGWTCNSSSQVLWENYDASSAPTSGCAGFFSFFSGAATLTLSQCIEADDSIGHALGGKITYFNSNPGDPAISFSLEAFDGPACAGSLLQTSTWDHENGVAEGQYQEFQYWTEPTAGTQSIEVLITATVDNSGSEVYLDDLFVIEMLFGDGFESGDTSGWSSLGP